jgi:hypothetical protein
MVHWLLFWQVVPRKPPRPLLAWLEGTTVVRIPPQSPSPPTSRGDKLPCVAEELQAKKDGDEKGVGVQRGIHSLDTPSFAGYASYEGHSDLAGHLRYLACS